MSYIASDYPKPHKLSHSVKEPLNREDDIEKLVSNFITPNEVAFDRNHGPIPHLSARDHRLVIDGIVASPLVLDVDELRNDFVQYEVACALQCAGNRRNTMGTLMKPVRGVGWNDGAVMNSVWSGILLRDVLLRAGVTSPFSANSSLISNTTDATETSHEDQPKARDIRDLELHVCFSSNSAPTQDCSTGFGGSIPLSRALDPDFEVLLALKMNGVTLPVNHGYPVRVIVPGQLGCRSVKWLDRITISVEESPSHYQRRDYKVLPEFVETWEQANGTIPGGDGIGVWPDIPAFADMPVNSAIALPSSRSTVTRDAHGRVEVKGYALPAGEHGPVIKVEISADEGKSWSMAEICPSEKSSKWCWTLWSISISIEPGEGRSIWSRATDKGGNIQPRFPAWNLRGLAYNGYGEVSSLNIM